MSQQRSQKLSVCVKVAASCLIIAIFAFLLVQVIIDRKRKSVDVKTVIGGNAVPAGIGSTRRLSPVVSAPVVRMPVVPPVIPSQPQAKAAVQPPSLAVFSLEDSRPSSDSLDLFSRTYHIRIDNSGIRAHLGKLDLEGAVMKVTWGNSDFQSPLDVVNPVDLSDPTEIDLNGRKIARPMLYGSYDLTSNIKIEGVFLPTFEGNSLPKGMLKPVEVAKAYEFAKKAYNDPINVTIQYPQTNTLEYAQAGFRVNRIIGSTDIGIQYFYGFLPKLALADIAVTADKALVLRMDFNRYQQIGADYSAVFGNYGVRSELAANITKDLSGTDGSVYNPAMLWSLGFTDSSLAGSRLDLQGSGSVRLMNDKIGNTPSDTEYGTNMTDTTMLIKISKKFAKDAIELSASARYGLETADCLVKPSVVWSKDRTKIELDCVFFAGDTSLFSGQYNARDSVALSFTQQL